MINEDKSLSLNGELALSLQPRRYMYQIKGHNYYPLNHNHFNLSMFVSIYLIFCKTNVHTLLAHTLFILMFQR